MDKGYVAPEPPAEIGVGELLSEAWEIKGTLLVVLLACTTLGGGAGCLNEKKYRAEILISPVADSPTGSVGGIGGLASQYGELASLAGLSLSGKGASNKDESIATLQSELITETYIKDHELLQVLFSKEWDSNAHRWRTAEGAAAPTLWRANQLFKKTIRDVKTEKGTGLVTLRITWKDPVVAALWANDLVAVTNRYLRDKAINESEQNIAYLNEEAAKTNIIEAKSAIYSILKNEVNKQMIAKGREEYALKVLDPARAPERPSSPPAIFFAAAGFFAGLAIAGILILRRSALFRKRT